MTIYLSAMNVEQRLKIKQLHDFVSDYLRSWFTLLPSYEAFRNLARTLLSGSCPEDCSLKVTGIGIPCFWVVVINQPSVVKY